MREQYAPIFIKFMPHGGGWAGVSLRAGGDAVEFDISYIGDDIGTLVDCVYYLGSVTGTDDMAPSHLDVEYRDGVCIETKDENGACRKETWDGVPCSASLLWDGEGRFMRISMTRSMSLGEDFEVDFEAAVDDETSKVLSCKVSYRDLCHAVAKAVTELINEYGITGLFESTWMSDINFRHLLRIKEIALGEDIRVALSGRNNDIARSSFRDEMELLARNM